MRRENTNWIKKVGGIEGRKIKISHFIIRYHNHSVKNSSAFSVTML
jgi:hypothetical protein